MKTISFISLCISLLISTGCVSVKSYVDPGFESVAYSDIKSPAARHQVVLETEFQRNGEHLPAVDSELRNHVERSLRATGVVAPEFGGTTVINVVVNNVADIAAARAKGFGTGLTFGAAGSTVADYYEISITMTVNGREVKTDYEHALHTTVGNASPPFPEVEATTIADGFGQIVEQAILKFVKDMQSQNLLSLSIDRLYL